MSDEETPTEGEPVPGEPTQDEAPPAADVPAAPAPEPATQPEPEVAPVAPVAAQPEPTVAMVAPTVVEPKRRGVFVPAWVGALVVLLVVAAIGFGVGRWTSDDSSSSTAIANNGGIVPQGPNNNGNGNGNGNGNTPNLPSISGAFLGVATENAANGVAIVSVGNNTPADGAGLEEGDVITAVDNTEVSSPAELLEAIQSHDPGDEVTIHYTRDGEDETVEVTLGSRTQNNPN